jgi:hypothetical protein
VTQTSDPIPEEPTREDLIAAGYAIPQEGIVVPTRRQLADVVQAMVVDAGTHLDGNVDQPLAERFAQMLDGLFGALAASQTEIARLTKINASLHDDLRITVDERNVATRDLARLTASRDALAQDAELGRAVRWDFANRKGALLIREIRDIDEVLAAYRAVLSTTTEAES